MIHAKTMHKNTRSNYANRGVPVKCVHCGVNIKVGDRYVRRFINNELNKYALLYCEPCADDLNII